ncbi:DEAD/DEAH box helicase [Galbitalea sp. SE-J8]|uniref:DEAD/DEAH box helicase n=1 Tax=Galbitalea sp. SE-J8 TaxID=3054952 RepID=UPI00259CB267|nr:DEAD/DEAH box helicase [Galbitalea sp. SE-J8]MDM4761565.1 DEAD/DEAH box helicase [Galbitalea sp. SE-J8]
MSQTFAELGVPAPLVTALAGMDRTEPFPIQADTLPDSLAGRDVLGRGKTGSGKTLAFAIPLVARLTDHHAVKGRRPRALVLAPTRELATQITATIEPLASAQGLAVTTIFGGVSQNRQVAALQSGVDIVVACPGRLEDLMKQGFAKLDRIEVSVLDEADHMADLGFLPVVTRILNATPQTGQRLLFSATLDNGVDKLVSRFLHAPVMHSVDEANSPVAAMTHYLFEVDAAEKDDLVRTLASGTGRRILFMRTKHHAKKLAKKLTDSGIPAVDLHGNLSQPARDRNLAAFGAGDVRVLVATDVAARGVHVDDIELVVHVDPPAEHKAYLHRSGRTARAGKEGEVVTIMLPSQRRDTLDLLRKAAIRVTPQSVTPSSDAVAALVGEVAAYVAPAPRAEQSASSGGGRSTGGRSTGANAQRKRAARDGGERGIERGGRGPAGSGSSAGGSSAAGSSAGGGRRRRGRGAANGANGASAGGAASASSEQQARSGQRGESRSAANGASGAGGQRGGNRRAGAPAGTPKLMVGSVVRPNRAGRSGGR